MGSFFMNPKVCPMPMLRLALVTSPGRSKSDPGITKRSVEVPESATACFGSEAGACACNPYATSKTRAETNQLLIGIVFTIIPVSSKHRLNSGQDQEDPSNSLFVI